MISFSWYVAGLVVMCTILPWVGLALLPVSVFYWVLMLHYRKSGADLQRLDAVSRSPIQAMVTEGKPCIPWYCARGSIGFLHVIFVNTQGLMAAPPFVSSGKSLRSSANTGPWLILTVRRYSTSYLLNGG
jgi:hypothetical protein